MSKMGLKLLGAALVATMSAATFAGPAQANPVPIDPSKCERGWLCLFNGISFTYPLPAINRANYCVRLSKRTYSIINNSGRTYYAYATGNCGGRVATIYPYTANNYTEVEFYSVDTRIHT
jgi:hypothetical protein